MKKLLAILLMMILALTSVSGVWAEAAEGEAPAEETPTLTYDYDELTVAVTTPLTGNFFTTLWGNASSDRDIRTLIHGYNLVEWDMENGVFIPDASVVSGVTVDTEANGDITFIIALYDDLFYSNGKAVTAWDYAFSMLLNMAPEMKELGATVLTPEYIAGYSDYISGKTEQLKGIRVISDHQLNITISSAYLPFFYELGLLSCVPYPVSEIAPGVKVADNGNGVYLANEDEANGEPVFTADLLKQTILDESTGYRTHPSVTSGPYKLVSYEDGTATLEINALYKGNSQGKKPTIPRIKVFYIAAGEMTPALKDGSVTLLNKVSDMQTITDCLSFTTEQPIITSANYARSGLGFISFNADKKPLDDPAVRKAIAYQADRDNIVKETLGQYGMRGIGYFGMGQWMYLLLNGTVQYPVEQPAEDADDKAHEEYDAAIQEWEALSIDSIEKYDRNPEETARILDEAGWNLNENGEPFDPEKDTLRCRKTEEVIEPLRLTLAYAEGSAAGKALEGTLVQSLAEAGIELTVDVIPADEMLSQYYRLSEVKYDMYFLATNFDVMFDPSLNFTETEDGHHVWKTSGLTDDELWEMAVDMRRTEAGDLLNYCRKWLAFQQHIMDTLPILPIYSNVYFDFYPQVLQGYHITDSISWPETIIDAYLGDVVTETEGEEPEAEQGNTAEPETEEPETEQEP